jgi:hypothetical protein
MTAKNRIYSIRLIFTVDNRSNLWYIIDVVDAHPVSATPDVSVSTLTLPASAFFSEKADFFCVEVVLWYNMV